MFRKLGLSIVVAALAATAGAGCGGGSSEPSIRAPAKVGDTTISTADLQGYLKEYLAVRGESLRSWAAPNYPACSAHDPRICRDTFRTMKAQAVGYLVRARWFELETKARGLDVAAASAHALDKTKQLYTRLGSYERGLKRSGWSEQGLKRELRVQAEGQALMRSIDISKAELMRYYRSNLNVYGPPQIRSVRLVRAKRKKAVAEAAQTLASSQVPGTKPPLPVESLTGDSSGLEEQLRDPPLAESVFRAQQGVLTGPIRTRSGWSAFVVKRISAVPTRIPREVQRNLLTRMRTLALDRQLHKHYDGKTVCAKQYRVPDASECLAGSREE